MNWSVNIILSVVQKLLLDKIPKNPCTWVVLLTERFYSQNVLVKILLDRQIYAAVLSKKNMKFSTHSHRNGPTYQKNMLNFSETLNVDGQTIQNMNGTLDDGHGDYYFLDPLFIIRNILNCIGGSYCLG